MNKHIASGYNRQLAQELGKGKARLAMTLKHHTAIFESAMAIEVALPVGSNVRRRAKWETFNAMMQMIGTLRKTLKVLEREKELEELEKWVSEQQAANWKGQLKD